MRALLLDRPGPPDTLRLGEASLPEPGAHEIRLRVHACALNPVDWKLMATGYPTWRWPHIPGLDIAGRVDAVGSSVGNIAVDDRVMAHLDLSRPGGLASHALTMAHTVSLLPAGIDWVVAASLPCAAMTAWHALTRRLHLASGQTLLIQGGAGGVGGNAIQMARHLGARVLATCSTGDRDYVAALGAEPIDYRRERLPERVRVFTGGRGVDAILEILSGQQAADDLQLLAFAGGMACLNGLPSLDRLTPFTISPSLHEIALGGAHLSGGRKAQEDLARMGDEILQLVVQGALRPLPLHRLTLAEAPAVLTRMARGEKMPPGKWVTVID